MPQEEGVRPSPVDNSREGSGIPPTVTRVTPAPPRLSSTRVVCAGVLVVAATLTACSPTPTPTPVFASEDEAFAAAEATYRTFTARLNQLDTADPATFVPLFELSSGEFERADRRAYATMHANGVVVTGDTKVLSFVGTRSSAMFAVVEATVCLDVSAVAVVDAAGVSQVDPDRPDVYALNITFVAERKRLLIDSAEVNEATKC